ncbi:hypothetical protein D910_07140 [Dendroctonus ponderosae]|uniref:Uncharacterized protein n=1 Tax=Dendroctonus ponderosae TaxID=77166 RepID=U4U7A0_DENPD|nr:hypothetical protein D910_07140 [Dendroctonus ponderosae]
MFFRHDGDPTHFGEPNKIQHIRINTVPKIYVLKFNRLEIICKKPYYWAPLQEGVAPLKSIFRYMLI